MKNKTCIKCGQEKNVDDFEIRPDAGKLRNQCKKCVYFMHRFRIQNPLSISKESLPDGTKRCSKCHKIKKEENFHLRTDSGKRRGICDDCSKLYFSKRYTNKKEEISSKAHKRYLKNPEKNKERVGKWKLKNPDKVKENRDNNKEKMNERQRIKYKENPIIRERYKQYRKNNPDKVKAWRKKDNAKLDTKICSNLCSRLRQAIKNNYKSGSAVRDLGCSIKEFKKYIENKFYINPKTEETMSWDNYGIYGWHIDHIIPLVNFDLTNREELLKACHYTNLQPLWAEDNLRKGSKII